MSKAGRIIYDVTDIVDFATAHDRPSGIQRVQIELFRRFQEALGTDIVGAYFSDRVKRFFPVDVGRLYHFERRYARHLMRRGKIFSKPWRLRPLRLKQGDRIVVPGCGWSSKKRTKYLRSRNVQVYWAIHDLVPLLHPWLTTGTQCQDYAAWLDETFDLPETTFICNSDYTKRELLRYAANVGHPVRAVTVPLAHEFPACDGRLRSRYDFLRKSPFILSVGTLEIRKNHVLLVDIWEHLYKALGDRTSSLVLAGRPGWLNEALNRRLMETDGCHGKIVHIIDATDEELTWLYSNCRFTVFPSLFEGWGLPVGESLWFGKPCICFDNSSLPEVGGGGAILCQTREQFETTVRNGIDGQFTVLPKPRAKLRTWQDVAEDMLDIIAGPQAVTAALSRSYAAFPIPSTAP